MKDFIEYLKAPSITDWIQAACALIFGVFAVIAFFKWKTQKHYDVKMRALGMLEVIYEFVYDNSNDALLLKNKLEISSSLDIYIDFLKDHIQDTENLREKFIYFKSWKINSDTHAEKIDSALEIAFQIAYFSKNQWDLYLFYDIVKGYYLGHRKALLIVNGILNFIDDILEFEKNNFSELALLEMLKKKNPEFEIPKTPDKSKVFDVVNESLKYLNTVGGIEENDKILNSLSGLVKKIKNKNSFYFKSKKLQ
ncbi:hypothetical protein ACTFAO_07365 [Sphingobacterium spiritivorum]|uniref:hypothetical protein n=1 Tax=Sphingobacterium spiritivorum TaxID=258 RepID=UPI003F76BA12